MMETAYTLYASHFVATGYDNELHSDITQTTGKPMTLNDRALGGLLALACGDTLANGTFCIAKIFPLDRLKFAKHLDFL